MKCEPEQNHVPPLFTELDLQDKQGQKGACPACFIMTQQILLRLYRGSRVKEK